jgi:hypothetical protein
MEGLTEGRMVHFVLEDGRHAGEHRPAIVVKVWNKDVGLVNLQVLCDGTNDYLNGKDTRWVTSAEYDESGKPRTWHWIEPA